MAPQRRKKQQQQRRRPNFSLRRLAAPIVRRAQKYSKPKGRVIGPMTAAQTLSDGARKYAAALLHPFSSLAEGATFPEPYAAATTCRKVRFELGIQPNATGDFDLALQPHLIYSGISGQGTITQSPLENTVTNCPTGFKSFGAVSGASLAAYYKSYRIVGWGVRLKTNVDFTKSGGRVYLAVCPASQQLPASFMPATTALMAYESYDIPTDALAGGSGRAISSSIVGLPRGHQCAVSELMSTSGVEITFPIVSAAATNFIEATNQYWEQGLAVQGASNTLLAGYSLGYASAAGHSQLLIRGVGITTGTAALVAEIIYHVEGIPNVNGFGTIGNFQEATKRLQPANPTEIAKVLHMASSVPAVQYVSEKMKSGMSAWGARGKAALASKVGHEAEKILGLGMKALML